MEQLKTFGREITAMSTQGSSRDFLDLVKAIGESKSKAEEDRIMLGELELLKRKIGEPDIPKRKMKEYIMRLVYVEMLGHDASFGHIHAVKMTHDDNLLLKRTGYLAVTLFLEENHDLIILIVNTIQKDLMSDNHLIVCAALGAVCKLISEETIPAVLPQIGDLLIHPKEVVRKKAIMALHRFYQRSPTSVSHLTPKFRQALSDKDPSVMSAALCALYDMAVADPASCRPLIGSFVSILKQVAESRLPPMYNYHKTPAPFVQIKLLKILSVLGANDKSGSDQMYGVLSEVMKRNEFGANIGNAILYECCCTITSIYPNNKLLLSCAEVTSNFLKSSSHNFRYMGIDALGRVVKINPDFGNEHQLAVIDCLEDPDDTLKRKTLELLYTMTSPSNVEVIVERMLGYLRGVQDSHTKADIAAKVVELAERFAPTNHWFLQTMNSVFEVAGDLVRPKAAHDLMRLIAEGSGEEDEEADSALRSYAVESYLTLLEEPKLPSILLQVMCWVLGEYGTADGSHSAEDIISRLCDVAEAHSEDDVVRGYAITAVTKIIAFDIGAGRQPRLMPEARNLIEELSASHSTDLQQRAYELQSLIGLNPETVQLAMPVDASCEDIEVDPALPFLSSFVEEALARGASPYLPLSQRLGPTDPPMYRLEDLLSSSSSSSSARPASSSSGLKFQAYEKPAPPPPRPTASLAPVAEEPPASFPEGSRKVPGGEEEGAGPATVQLRLDGVQKKWGRPTYASASEAASSSSAAGQPTAKAPSSWTAGASEAAPAGRERDGERGRSDSSSQAVSTEVSAEKQRLAASLFGGGGGSASSSSSSATVPGRGLPGRGAHRSQSARGAGGGAGGGGIKLSSSAKAAAGPPPAPPPDLLDFGVSDDMVVLAPSAQGAKMPASDPFKELEDLLEAPSVAAASSNGAPAPVSASAAAIDLLSLYEKVLPGQGSAVGGGVGAEKKGESVQRNEMQKDAIIRQAGVVPGSESPELLKDIFS